MKSLKSIKFWDFCNLSMFAIVIILYPYQDYQQNAYNENDLWAMC